MMIASKNNVANVMGGFSAKCIHNVVASTALITLSECESLFQHTHGDFETKLVQESIFYVNNSNFKLLSRTNVQLYF